MEEGRKREREKERGGRKEGVRRGKGGERDDERECEGWRGEGKER